MAISHTPIPSHDGRIHWRLCITVQNRVEIEYTKYHRNCDNTIQYYKKVRKEVHKLNYWLVRRPFQNCTSVIQLERYEK